MPFDEKETEQYVEGRLRKAGYTGRAIFKRSALREIYRVSGGTPRLINSVCDSALLLGYSRQLPILGSAEIGEVAVDLELVNGSGRSPGRGTTTDRPRRSWLSRGD